MLSGKWRQNIQATNSQSFWGEKQKVGSASLFLTWESPGAQPGPLFLKSLDYARRGPTSVGWHLLLPLSKAVPDSPHPLEPFTPAEFSRKGSIQSWDATWFFSFEASSWLTEWLNSCSVDVPQAGLEGPQRAFCSCLRFLHRSTKAYLLMDERTLNWKSCYTNLKCSHPSISKSQAMLALQYNSEIGR